MVPDTEVLLRSGMINIHTMLCKAQLSGLAMWLECHIIVYQRNCFVGKLQAGKRSQGEQKKRYKDTLRASLKCCCIDSADWENVATYCSTWCYKTGRGTANLGKERVHNSIRKRSLRKLHFYSTSSSALSQPCLHQCQQCNRLFRARSGLISHLRTHSKID
jgi:hypothetical protein